MAVHFFPEVNIGGTGSLDDYIALIEKGSANGVATLDSTSKIPSSQLPNIAITNTFIVNSELELLALTAQVGDVAIRTDLNKSFILQSEPASVLSNWLELLTPPDTVLSVDGKTGVVNLSDKYQALSNELSGISALADTPGFIKKTGDGAYSIDASNYLTNNQTITLSGDVVGTGTTSINASISSVSWLKVTNTPTTLIGYGITNAYSKLDVDQRLSGKQDINNELTAISNLADTPGFMKKTGDGTYSIDASNYLTNNQTITLSGDVTGSGTTSINVTLPNIVTAGSSAKPTYNAKGLITDSGALLASDIPALDATKIINTAVTLSDAQTITGQKTLTGGVIINDTITESSISTTELFTSWQSATGWTINGANTTHTTGTTAINATVGTITTNEVYQLVVTITGRTLGNVVITFGGNTSAAITTTTTFHFPAKSTTSPSFLPTTDFDGVVSLSVRLITPSSIFVSGMNGIKGRSASSFIGLGTDKYRIQDLSNASSAFGVNAGLSNTTGVNWSAFGVGAGYSNTTGSSWSAFGVNAGRSNTTGINWSAFGVSAGHSNTTGSFWSAFGVGAGYSNTTGSSWSAFGRDAGRSNTTGINWSAFGVGAGYSNTTGSSWSAFGVNAGLSNTTGSFWSAFGVSAGLSNTGSGGVFLGHEAGYNSTNESNCLYIANNRTFTFLKGDNINEASTSVLRVNGTVASTSTTTGALVVSGGIGCQALFATSLNGAGSGLTTLNASNLASGTIPDARLVGAYSNIASLFRPGTTNALFLKGGNETIGSGAIIRLYGKDNLGGQAYLDSGTMYFRSLDGTIIHGLINANGLSINTSTASTSTTTGAVTVLGGVGVQGDIWCNYSMPTRLQVQNSSISFDSYSGAIYQEHYASSEHLHIVGIPTAPGSERNIMLWGTTRISPGGKFQLPVLTTATRPVASASTLGQIWLNTDTGKIEYVATSSTIQVITST